MRRKAFVATLKSHAVFSASAATEGGHQSLDYIPGQMLLGVVANKLYPQNDSQKAWELFHSGKVRFGFAYPLDDEQPTLPMPLSLHITKENEGSLFTEIPFYNFLKYDPSTPTQGVKPQFKQQRSGYLSAHALRVYKLPKTTTFKTAIDRKKGRHKDSHLFGYESIPAGEQFYFEIHFDDSIDHSWDDEVCKALTESTVFLGRSRSAEYGWTDIREVKVADFLPPNPLSSPQTTLTFYCFSPLALRDPETGMPTFQPKPEHFGLKSGTFDRKHSFLRTMRYSTFNSKRRNLDLERQTIKEGSLITFKDIDPNEDLEAVRHYCEAGIGDYRESGLGQVIIEPLFLQGKYLALSTLKKVSLNFGKRDQKDLENSHWKRTLHSDPLFSWLEQFHDNKMTDFKASELARQWAEKLSPKLPKSGGPSPNQWGELRLHATKYKSFSAFMHFLFENDGKKNVSKEKGFLLRGVRAKKWKKKVKGQPFWEHLRNTIKKTSESDEVKLKAFQILSSRIAKENKGEEK